MKKEFQLSSTEFKKVEQAKTETVETFDYSITFLKGKMRSIGYAKVVEWVTPLGDTIDGSVLTNGSPTIDKLYVTKRNAREGSFLYLAG